MPSAVLGLALTSEFPVLCVAVLLLVGVGVGDSETTISKSSCATAANWSVALTRTVIVPISPELGVPLNSRVEALKLNQAGSAALLESVAL